MATSTTLSVEQMLQGTLKKLVAKYGYTAEDLKPFLDESVPVEKRFEMALIEKNALKDRAKITGPSENAGLLAKAFPTVDGLIEEFTSLPFEEKLTLAQDVQRDYEFKQDVKLDSKPEDYINKFITDWVKSLPTIPTLKTKTGEIKLEGDKYIRFTVNSHIPGLYPHDEKNKKLVDYTRFCDDASRVITEVKKTNPTLKGIATTKVDGTTEGVIVFNKKIYHMGHTVKTEDGEGRATSVYNHFTYDIVKTALTNAGVTVKRHIPVIIWGEFYGKGIQSFGSRMVNDHTRWMLFDVRTGFHDEVCLGWETKETVEKVYNGLKPYMPNLDLFYSHGEMTLSEAIEQVIAGFKTEYCWVNGVNLGPCDQALDAEGLVVEFWNQNVRYQLKVRADELSGYVSGNPIARP